MCTFQIILFPVACSSDPCGSHGSCTEGAAACTCNTGWEGKECNRQKLPQQGM